MFSILNVSKYCKLGKSGSTSFRRAGYSMANNKRGPQPGSQKAKHGGQAVREKYGPEFYSKIGKMGGESTKRKQGSEFYSKIGKKGGERGRAAASPKD